MVIDKSKLFVLEKNSLFSGILFLGLLLAYYSTLYPWPLWPIAGHVETVAGFVLLLAFIFKPHNENTILTRNDFLLAVLLYATLEVYQRLVGNSNVVRFMSIPFHVVIFMILFRLDKEVLPRLMQFITKFMAIIELPAIFFFILYIFGFPLPYTDASYDNEFYFFTNYYFFLIDDRFLTWLFPRFQAYFVEPNHNGCACVFLLFYQCGKWKKWYNIVLLTSVLLSFSLTAYVLLVVVMFLNLWRKRKRFLLKIIIPIAIIGSVIGGSFLYNDGNNLVHDLILIRLEVEDGDIAGNNRVTKNFEHDFDRFLKSDDILFGRKRDMTEFGNSGYKVYIYEKGFVGLFLLIAFYVAATYKARNIRSLLSAWLMATLYFISNGEITWFQIFIPTYCAAYALPPETPEEEKDNEADEKSLKSIET